jgi:hypothetical protein
MTLICGLFFILLLALIYDADKKDKERYEKLESIRKQWEITKQRMDSNGKSGAAE